MSHLVLLPSLYEVACLGKGEGGESAYRGEKDGRKCTKSGEIYQRVVKKDYNCRLGFLTLRICEFGVLFTVVLHCT